MTPAGTSNELRMDGKKTHTHTHTGFLWEHFFCILYKNLDLPQDFPNKILFHFLWVKMFAKKSKISRWPEMCPLGKILAQDFEMTTAAKIMRRRYISIPPLLSLGDKAQRKRPDHRMTLYNRALEITRCESIETTLRTRILLWAGTLLRMSGGRLPKRIMFGNLEDAVRRGRGGKEKEWTDCVQSDIRAFGITGDWKTMALKG